MSVHTIATLSPVDFERGRSVIPELADYRDYEDWVDCREGSFIGLAMAGAETRLVAVSLRNFLSWCFGESIEPTEAALDKKQLPALEPTTIEVSPEAISMTPSVNLDFSLAEFDLI